MKIICIGRNYVAHIDELNNEKPSEPVIFIKPDSALLRNGNPFVRPDFSQNIHYELELVIKIKKPGKAIPKAFASDYYDEVSLGIDMTARDLQDHLKAKGLPWEKAKAFDHSAVIGTFRNKEGLDLNDCHFRLEKNGQNVQLGHTSLMLWPIDEIIEHVSQYFMLKTGDYIYTGTPAGVGPIAPGDRLVGYLEDQVLLETTVV
jgi:2-keto-4-pentenoate hydratase/2-oxohepta-3-ene-1,7-dioic acid hydratase in catechol pathway